MLEKSWKVVKSRCIISKPQVVESREKPMHNLTNACRGESLRSLALVVKSRWTKAPMKITVPAEI